MSQKPLPRNITIVKQRHHGRTEHPITKEIGGQIHQNGGIHIRQSYGEEQMHRVVGRKYQ